MYEFEFNLEFFNKLKIYIFILNIRIRRDSQ